MFPACLIANNVTRQTEQRRPVMKFYLRRRVVGALQRENLGGEQQGGRIY